MQCKLLPISTCQSWTIVFRKEKLERVALIRQRLHLCLMRYKVIKKFKLMKYFLKVFENSSVKVYFFTLVPFFVHVHLELQPFGIYS